jgi:aminotransferase
MTSNRTARRTHNFTESVIRGMTRLATQHGAINLAQGFPNFPTPDLIKQAAAEAIYADINQYAITWGSKRLRDVLAARYQEWYGMTVDPEADLTVTCGATEAMATVLLAVVDPGDEVVVLSTMLRTRVPQRSQYERIASGSIQTRNDQTTTKHKPHDTGK